MSEVQEKSVPIKVQGIPIGEVMVRRDPNTGEVTVSKNIYGWSDVNFKLIAQLTFDEDQETAVDDPGAKFRNHRNQMGLNGL